MRKIREPCALLILLLLICFRPCMPVYGMELPAREETSGMNPETEGKDIRVMGSRIPVYETLGEALIRKLSEDQGTAEEKNTGITFDTVEEAVSFGRYFYRYVYWGKQEIRLAPGRDAEGVTIYAWCDDIQEAVSQHRQVAAKLEETAAGGFGLSDGEKAAFFYDWVYENVDYDAAMQNKTIYDAVMKGQSVCWGYVSTYLMLCRMAGLTCEPVYQGNHAWNRVWIDGGWKYCDITWDKSLGEHRWKLITEEEMERDSMHETL